MKKITLYKFIFILLIIFFLNNTVLASNQVGVITEVNGDSGYVISNIA